MLLPRRDGSIKNLNNDPNPNPNTKGQKEIQRFINEKKCGITMEKTTGDMNTFCRYLESMEKKNVESESLPPAELDHLLCNIFVCVQRGA